MVTYIIRRLLLVPLLLFGVSILIFGMLQFLDPVERASLYIRGNFPTDEQIAAVVKRYCLDCPIYKQYTNWLVGTIMTLGVILLLWPLAIWLMEKNGGSPGSSPVPASAGASAVDRKK